VTQILLFSVRCFLFFLCYFRGFSSPGRRFHGSTTLTVNEYFLVSVRAYCTARPWAAAACLVLTLFSPRIGWSIVLLFCIILCASARSYVSVNLFTFLKKHHNRCNIVYSASDKFYYLFMEFVLVPYEFVIDSGSLKSCSKYWVRCKSFKSA
jgi:hypothetical protein